MIIGAYNYNHFHKYFILLDHLLFVLTPNPSFHSQFDITLLFRRGITVQCYLLQQKMPSLLPISNINHYAKFCFTSMKLLILKSRVHFSVEFLYAVIKVPCMQEKHIFGDVQRAM